MLYVTDYNKPRSMYQYFNMAPRLSGQTSTFGAVFSVSKSVLVVISNRPRASPSSDFVLLARLLPEWYSTLSNY